jgi:hypothetical protein
MCDPAQDVSNRQETVLMQNLYQGLIYRIHFGAVLTLDGCCCPCV